MYVCFECWRAEMNFKRAIFFRVLVQIIFLGRDFVSTRGECLAPSVGRVEK